MSPVTQVAKPPESPKMKSKFTRITKHKEPEPEVIKLKKNSVKPPELDKQVVTHKAEVKRHQVQELFVHGLHDREDREIITLGRTEKVFTAEEEAYQLGHLEDPKGIIAVQEMKKEGWIRTSKPQKEEGTKVATVDKKKITQLPRVEDQDEIVKLKPFERFAKQEKEQQKSKLKKAPTKPMEPEKDRIQKAEVTRHHNTEMTVHELHDEEKRELTTLGRTERVLTADEEAHKQSYKEECETSEAEDETTRWIRTPQMAKDEEPGRDLSKKKIKVFAKKEEEPEIVTLKPFEKLQKAVAVEPPEAKKESETKTDQEFTSFRRVGTPQRDQPTAATKHRRDEDVPLTSPDSTPDDNDDQKDVPWQRKVDQVPKNDEPKVTDKLHGKPKAVLTAGKEQEQVFPDHLKNVYNAEEKFEKASEEETEKPMDTKVPTSIPTDKTPKDVKKQPSREDDKTTTPKEPDRTPQEKEGPAFRATKPSPPIKEMVIPQEETEGEITQKPVVNPKKGIELGKTPSPRIGKDKVEDLEKAFKPIEQIKKVGLKKIPSPRVDKPKSKEQEQVSIKKNRSAEKVQNITKDSPQDSRAAVNLKQVPKRPSSEEPLEPESPGRGWVPLVKEVSPGAVEMKKVPTHLEEEVFQEGGEEMTGQADEEVWGWELVPSEDWEGQGVDGALETPGMPGGKRGEVKSNKPPTDDFGTPSSHLRQLI